MKKTLSRIGILLCIGGILLGMFATRAHFSAPTDRTGAGAQYDEFVNAYNKQLKEMADANPNLPDPAFGKTWLQAHKEDTMFGMIVAGLMFTVGLVLYYLNRSQRAQATS
ncbi:MAG: hypothetical protein ACC628_09155 [Pirellulaceae bacterium]